MIDDVLIDSTTQQRFALNPELLDDVAPTGLGGRFEMICRWRRRSRFDGPAEME